MNKNELALQLIRDEATNLEYEITFIPQDSNIEVCVGYSHDQGLYGNYEDDKEEIDYMLKCAKIIKIIIQ